VGPDVDHDRNLVLGQERQQSGDFDAGTFAKEIGPELATVPLAAMMRATGLSLRCSTR
jgi:hypothetical protein